MPLYLLNNVEKCVKIFQEKRKESWKLGCSYSRNFVMLILLWAVVDNCYNMQNNHLNKTTMRLIPANIRLDEDVLKTSWRRLSSSSSEDVLIKTNMFTLDLFLQKTSSRCLQDVLVKTNIFALAIGLQHVFKAFSRRLQDIFKTSSRHLQDVSSS